jgi:hypothetical protein
VDRDFCSDEPVPGWGSIEWRKAYVYLCAAYGRANGQNLPGTALGHRLYSGASAARDVDLYRASPHAMQTALPALLLSLPVVSITHPIVRYPLSPFQKEKRMGLLSPRPPWLAALPDHPARRFVRRVILWLWIGIPALPLLGLPFVQPPGVAILLSLMLALVLGVVYFAIGGLLKLLGKLQQYCPQCYTAMHIGAQVCPACQFMPDPSLARDASLWRLRLAVMGSLLGGLVAVGSGVASAEGARYFDCPIVAYFGEPCAGVSTQVLPPQSPTPMAPSPEEPLFTPQTVSPDTPPLMLRLLQEPTESNALAYIRWQRKRLERTKEVQTLLEKVTAAYKTMQEDAPATPEAENIEIAPPKREETPSRERHPADG